MDYSEVIDRLWSYNAIFGSAIVLAILLIFNQLETFTHQIRALQQQVETLQKQNKELTTKLLTKPVQNVHKQYKLER